MAGTVAQQIIVELVVVLQSHVIGSERIGIGFNHTADEQSEDGDEVACLKRRVDTESEAEHDESHDKCASYDAGTDGQEVPLQTQTCLGYREHRSCYGHDDDPQDAGGEIVPFEKILQAQACQREIDNHLGNGSQCAGQYPHLELMQQHKGDDEKE